MRSFRRNYPALAASIVFAVCAPQSASAQRRHTAHPAHPAHPAAAGTTQNASAAPSSGAPSSSTAASTSSTTPSTGTSLPPVPLAPGEAIGNRVARARTLLEQLEFEQVVALLEPIHGAPGVTPTLEIAAAMIETEALVALQNTERATDVCKRAVVAANYDPDVAHSQPARVQAVCRVAADQARRELVQSRGLAIGDTRITPGPVAFNPVEIQVRFDGDLTGFTTQAEVTINDGASMVVNMPSTGQPQRSATLDANLATPGARIRVNPIIRDSFGVLLQGTSPIEARVPTDQSAVRFALGSDEGPLSVDGHASGAHVQIGQIVPIPPGEHDLSVETRAGTTSTAHIALHPGEVQLLTLHSAPSSVAYDVAKWGSTGGAIVLALVGGLAQLEAYNQSQQFNTYANTTDPQTGLPVLRYSDVRSTDQNRTEFQNVAIGFFAGAGVLAVVAVVLWALPRGHVSSDTHDTRPASAFHIMPTSTGLALTF